MRRAWIAAALCAASVGSARADWTVRRDPFDATVAARYRQILTRDPYDAGALAALKTMYTRYRTLAKLEAELGADWAAAVVRARLHPDTDHWRAVIAIRADDARALIALADLERNPGLYQAALAATSDRALQRRCLTALIALEADSDRITALFDRLAALTPNDPTMWIDRAHTMSEHGRHDAAVAAYDRAVQLLATDPPAQLEAMHGRASELEQAGDLDGAVKAYEQVIARAPATHYLAEQAWVELVAVHDERGTLDELLARVRARFPHPGHAQWKLLVAIHDAKYQEEEALAALKQAVKSQPTDPDTQRDLIERLEASGKPGEAFAQLEAAARAIPGDFELQSDLATRYHDRKNTPAAVAVMQRVSDRLRNDAGVHEKLVEVYTAWNRPALVAHELDELARLEPETDRLLALGDAYWQIGNEAKALAAWKRIEEPLERAQVFSAHEYWTLALEVLTAAVVKTPKDPALWRARSDVYLGLQQWDNAEADARTAIALVSGKPMDAAHDTRYQLVRVLLQREESEPLEEHESGLPRAIKQWQASDDLDALYMLAEVYGRQAPTEQLLAVLQKLRTRVPDDAGVVTALVRTYKVLHRYDDAIAELHALAARDPSRKDIAEQVADLEHRKQDLATSEPVTDPEVVTVWRGDGLADLRVGLRIGVGTGVRGPNAGTMVLGAYGSVRLSDRVLFIGRLDWTERASEMTTVSSIGLTSGIGIPIATLSHATVLAGVGYRSEVRVGDHAGWDTLGFAADATLDVVPRGWPFALGARLEQGLSDHGQASSVLLEVSVGK